MKNDKPDSLQSYPFQCIEQFRFRTNTNDDEMDSFIRLVERETSLQAGMPYLDNLIS